MDSWINVIIEWINCLGINEKAISHIDELDNELIYKKILIQLNRNDNDSVSVDSIDEFIKNEYPEFSNYKEDINGVSNNVFISSLLLLTASQKISFHRPMCTLKNETQIMIKKFLEIMLPFDKSITRDIMVTTIAELADSIQAPKTPNNRPLKNFFTSPAAQSAHRNRLMNEKLRDLRLLKAQLETERFEKADLIDDLKSQEEKIVSLQRKLSDKTAELKLLKSEKSRIQTPQSCRKNNKKQDNKDEILKKEIQNLEEFNAKLKEELDQVMDEKMDINQKLLSKERLNGLLKEKSQVLEKNLEALMLQFEMKTNELLDLRVQNEELRSHISNMQTCNLDVDQSFEVDNMPRARSPTPCLNTSEALSTIIDIQLQEAKEESAKLQQELDQLNVRLSEALVVCEESKKVKEELSIKNVEFEKIKLALDAKTVEHSKTICQLEELTREKNNLVENLTTVEKEAAEKNDCLEKSEELRLKLEKNLQDCVNKIQQLEVNLNKVTSDVIDKDKKLGEMYLLEKKLNENLEQSQNHTVQLETKLNEQVLSFKENTKNLELKIREIGDDKKKLEDDLEKRNVEFLNVLEMVEDKNMTIAGLNTRILEIENENVIQNGVIKEKETKLLEVNELNDELQSQLVQERNNLLDLSRNKRDLELNLSALESEKMSMLDEISKLNVDLKNSVEQSKEFEDKSKDYESKYKNSLEKIDLLTSEGERLGGNISEAISEISRLKEFQENLENQLTLEHDNCAKLVAEKAALDHLVSTKDLEVADLSFKIQSLEVIIKQNESQCQEMEGKYEKLVAEHQEISRRLEESILLNCDVNLKLEGAESRIQELENHKTSLEAELTAEKNHLGNVVIEKNDLVEKLSAEKIKTAELAEELSTSHQKIQEINQEFERVNKEIESKHENLVVDHQETLKRLEESTSLNHEVNLKLEASQSRVQELENHKTSLGAELAEERINLNNIVMEKSKLAEELSEEKIKITKLDEEISAGQEKLQRITEELERTNEKMGEKHGKLVDELNEKSRQLEELTLLNSDANLKLEAVQSRVLELEQKETYLEVQLAEEKIHLDSIVTEKNNLAEELSTEKNKTTKLAEELSTSHQKIQEINQEFERVNKEIEAKHENLVADHQETLKRLEESTSLNHEVNLKLEGAESRIQELENHKTSLEAELTTEKNHLGNVVIEKNDLVEKLSAEKIKTAELAEELSTSHQKIQELNQEFEIVNKEMKEKHENLVADHQKTLKRLEESTSLNHEVNLKLEGAESRLQELENHKTSLESQLSDEKINLNNIVMEKNKLAEELSAEKIKTTRFDEELTTSQQKIKNSSEEFELIYKKYIDLENSYSAAEEKIQELNSKLEALNSLVTSKDQELSEEKEKNKITNEKKESLEKELSAINLEKQELEEKLSQFDDKLSKTSQDHEEVFAKLSALETKYQESLALIAAKQTEIEEKQNQLEALNSKILEAEKEHETLVNKVSVLSEDKESTLLKLHEKIKTIDELTEAKNLLILSHEEHELTLNNHVKSLEEQLLDMQKSLETEKLNSTQKEDSLLKLESKIKELIDDKNESEFKMKSIIDNLQEVRSSQDAVLETQSKALAAKLAEIDSLEEQHLTIKDKLLKEIETEKEKNEKLIQESIALTASNEEKLSLLEEEYKKNLSIEEREVSELKEKIEKISKSRDKLVDMSKNFIDVLKNKLSTEESGDFSELNNQFLDDSVDPSLAELLSNMEKVLDSIVSIKKNQALEKQVVENKLQAVEDKISKYDSHLSGIIKNKQHLMDLIEQVSNSRESIEDKLSKLKKSWGKTTLDSQNIPTGSLSVCDELKHLESIKVEQEKLFDNINNRLTMSSRSLIDVLTRTLTWMENNLDSSTDHLSTNKKIDLDEEKLFLEEEIKKNNDIQEDLNVIELKIEEFKNGLSSYEMNLKSGAVKREPSTEEKLQIQIDKLTTEKKDMKAKLDAMRLRNTKLEKNMDDIRSDNKKLKTEMSSLNLDKSELEQLKTHVQELYDKLDASNREKSELSQRLNNDDLDKKLTQVHSEYGEKLEKIKQKMKAAYNDQMAKLKEDQEKVISDRVQLMQAKMEQQCKKYTEDIAKYKAHISDLSSQFWDVGEKLLAEKQEKKVALQKIQEIQSKQQQISLQDKNQRIAQANLKIDPDIAYDFPGRVGSSGFRSVEFIEEETTTRRHSVKSIQAMGNAFKVEDEEEIFDNVYLADLKEGQFRPQDTYQLDRDRLSELRMRNSLCKPHLKSSYAAETMMHPLAITEEDIKNGPMHEDIFNDSLSQSLLPGQKIKKKDRTQTSYKRPGPPTPSKNGGRLSLQGNEFKSPTSGILKERNSKRTTATPKRLKDLFSSSSSKRQDENAPGTPKGRRLSNIFRIPRAFERS